MCAKRTIIECDLCKAEVDESEGLSKVIIKKPKSTGKGQIYEICPCCNEKLQQQLVSRSNLSEKWGFGIPSNLKPLGIPGEIQRAPESDSEPPEEDENTRQVRYVRGRQEARRRRREQSEVSFQEGDEGFGAEVGATPEMEISDTGLYDRPKDIAKVKATVGNKKCPHYNKTPPKWGRIDEDGEVVDTMYQKCTECNATLRYRTREQQAKLLSGRTGNVDVSLKTHGSETRKRT